MATRAGVAPPSGLTTRRRVVQPASLPQPPSPPQVSPPISPDEARNDATEAWTSDLKTLWDSADERLPDVSWTTAPPFSPTSSPKSQSTSNDIVAAHRAIVLARAPKTFRAKYLDLPLATPTSRDSPTATPPAHRIAKAATATRRGTSTSPSTRAKAASATPRRSALRPAQPSSLQSTPSTSVSSKTSTLRKPLHTPKQASSISSPPPLSLASSIDSAASSITSGTASSNASSSEGLDIGLLKRCLAYLYTSEATTDDADLAEALSEDALPIDAPPEERLERLRTDFLALWQNRQGADIELRVGGRSSTDSFATRSPHRRDGKPLSSSASSSSAIALPMEDAGDEETAGIFAAHRIVLASRSPYFAAQLLSSYSDSKSSQVHLPSPPFTPTALYFTLGFLYTGTLSFSPRTFDLTTAFQIWRASAYLQVTSLSRLIGSLIYNDFCHKFTCSPPCTTCVKRVPRTLAFAASPDVADATLRGAALRAVSGPHFGAYWSREVGSMDAAVRGKITASIKARLQREAGSVVSVLSQSLRVERTIEGERSSKWTDNLRSMIDDVADQAKQLLLQNLDAIVASQEWENLVEGVGLLDDVLERCLDIIVKGLTDSNAARVYATIVEHVLLKGEEGMAPGQMKDRVEQARSDILGFLRKRWVNVRSIAGFNKLDKWVLKEIAGEIDVPSDDLLLDEKAAGEAIKSKTGLKAAATNPAARRAAPSSTATPRKPLGAVARPAVRADDSEREAGPVNLRAAVLNRNAAKSSATHGFRSGTTRASNGHGPSATTTARRRSNGASSPSATQRRFPLSPTASADVATVKSTSSGSSSSSSSPASPPAATPAEPEAPATPVVENEVAAASSEPDVAPPSSETEASSRTTESTTRAAKPTKPALGSRVAGLAARFQSSSTNGSAGPSRPPASAAAPLTRSSQPFPTTASPARPLAARSGSPVIKKSSSGPGVMPVKRPSSRPRVGSPATTTSRGSSRVSSRAASPAVRSQPERRAAAASADRSSSDGVTASSPQSTVAPSSSASASSSSGPPTVQTMRRHLTPSAAEPWLRSSNGQTTVEHSGTPPPPAATRLVPSRAASVASLASLRASVRRRNVSMTQSSSRGGSSDTPTPTSDPITEETPSQPQQSSDQAQQAMETPLPDTADESKTNEEPAQEEEVSSALVGGEAGRKESLGSRPEVEGTFEEVASNDAGPTPLQSQEALAAVAEAEIVPEAPPITVNTEAEVQEEVKEEAPADDVVEVQALESPTTEAAEPAVEAMLAKETQQDGRPEESESTAVDTALEVAANEEQICPSQAVEEEQGSAPKCLEEESAGEATVSQQPAASVSDDASAVPTAIEEQQALDPAQQNDDDAIASLRSRDSNETLMVDKGSPDRDEGAIRLPPLNGSGDGGTPTRGSLAPSPHTPRALRKMPFPGSDSTGEDSLERTPRPSRAVAPGLNIETPEEEETPAKTPRAGIRVRSPSSAAAYAASLAAAFPAASLSVGIPCIIWPSSSPFPPRTRLRALVKYIGPVEGYEMPMVGVEVEMPLPRALRSRCEGQFNDGCANGIRYFNLSGSEQGSDAASMLTAATTTASRTSSIASSYRDPHDRSGASTPSTTPFLPAPPQFGDGTGGGHRSISPTPTLSGASSAAGASGSGTSRLSEHLDMFQRAEREARRRRIARLQNRAADVLAASAAWSASAPVSPELRLPEDDVFAQHDGLPVSFTSSSPFAMNGGGGVSNRSISMIGGSSVGFPSSSLPTNRPSVSPVPRYAPGVPLRIASDTLVPTKATTTTATMQRNASAQSHQVALSPFPSMSPPPPTSSSATMSRPSGNSAASAFLHGYGLAIERERRASWSPELALALSHRGAGSSGASTSTSPRSAASPPSWRTTSTFSTRTMGSGSTYAARRSSRPVSRGSRRSRKTSMLPAAFGGGGQDGYDYGEEDEDEDEETGQGGAYGPGLGLFVRPDEVMWVFEDE